jgi:hypothetical protein
MINNGNFEFLILSSKLWKIFHSRKSFINLKFVVPRLAALGFTAIMLSAGLAGAGSLTTGADFLLQTTGARPDGMGQAFSAVADDINTLSFNPAGLGNIRLPEIGYGHEDFFADTGFDFVGAALPMGDAGVLGLGYLGVGTAPFNSTNNPSAPLVSVQDTALIAGWGKSYYDLEVGAAVKYINETVAGVQGNGLGFDLGVRYRLIPELALAGSVLNIGPGIQFASLEPLPLDVNVGAAWTVLNNPDHNLTLASDISIETTASTQRYSFGTEYWYKNMFALRVGYLANSQEEGISAGLGFKYSFFELDYAYEPDNNLGSISRFSGLFRWDGPWISGGEPNPPLFVTAQQDGPMLEIRWNKPQGPVKAYEVILQPTDGDAIISSAISDTVCQVKNFAPDTLYRITVRSIGFGGALSFPSKEISILTLSQEAVEKKILQEQKNNGKNESVSRELYGKVDSVGLQLSWAPARDKNIVGYNLYRKSPTGPIEKVSLSRKLSNEIWVSGVSGLWNYEWIVTVVQKDGREKTWGNYLWRPSAQEINELSTAAPRHLKAIPQPKRQVFLVWDEDPEAVGYTLLYSLSPDGVYEVYKEIKGVETNVLLNMPGGRDTYYFIVVSQRSDDEDSLATQEAKVQLYQDVPAQ